MRPFIETNTATYIKFSFFIISVPFKKSNLKWESNTKIVRAAKTGSSGNIVETQGFLALTRKIFCDKLFESSSKTSVESRRFCARFFALFVVFRQLSL